MTTVSATSSTIAHRMRVQDYDLAATLTSGQAFRWRPVAGAWEGVIAGRWVLLTQTADGIQAEVAETVNDWHWLEHYLQTQVSLADILAQFPAEDPHLQQAVQACRGLRLLRQEPWECLASFILSATKQIVQIQQIVARLSERFGQSVAVPPGHAPVWAFPTARELAARTELELRACGMGFRARPLREAAQKVADGEINLAALGGWDEARARETLMQLRGVGPKIANCVLLFAYGFPRVFPVDVWVMRALRQFYFPRRRPTRARLERFIPAHFGARAGYAQQYLFHYLRHHRVLSQSP